MELTSEQTLKLNGSVGFFASVGEQQDARLKNWSGARKKRKKEKRCSIKNKSQNKKQAGFAASQQVAADNSSPAG